MADSAVGGVLHGAVALHMADGAVRAVLDGAVVLDMGDGPVAGVGDLLGGGFEPENGCQHQAGDNQQTFHSLKDNNYQ